MTEDIEFVEGANKIIAALKVRSMSMMEDERIRYVYNEAIDDASNFVRDLGMKNPDIRLACIRLEDAMREWLPLKENQS